MPELEVLDSTMHYEDAGSGDPIVLLHGNPTSSYVWRNVSPEVQSTHRCVAPDLIGMGRSGKPDIGYRFADHARYLDAFLGALDLGRVTLVGHDWGGALGFDWAARHPDRVSAIVFMETIVRPLTWDDFPDPVRGLFAALRRPGDGEAMAIDANVFIESVLPASLHRTLSPEEHAAYRQPFREPQHRRPLLAWPREIPIDGQPADVAARVASYSQWLRTSTQVPKLLLTVDPGAVMSPALVGWCQQHVATLNSRHLGAGLHLVQEDQGPAIGAAIADWLANIRP
jgi:haloalkane dehalogenase